MEKIIIKTIILFTFMVSLTSLAQQPLQVGTSPTGSPFSFVDKDGKPTGIMVELIKAIFNEENLQLDNVQVMSFSALIPSLTSGKIDIISAGMYITDKRSEVVKFSDPILEYGEGLIVPENNKKKYTKFEDLKGYTIGVQKGTVYVKPLEDTKVFKQIKFYDSIATIAGDVANGRIQAGFGDKPIIAYGLVSKNLKKVRLVKEYKSVVVGKVGIAVQLDNFDLMEKINNGLAKVKKSGKFDSIMQSYGM